MKPTVYVETTIPSYLTAWPSRDVVRAGEQQVTRDWWAQRSGFELRVSSLVLLECGAGDPGAAALRLGALEGVPVLAQTPGRKPWPKFCCGKCLCRRGPQRTRYTLPWQR